MKRAPALIFALIQASAAMACAANTSEASGEADLTNQPSDDMTVLKVAAQEPINGYGSPGFAADQCIRSSDGETYDCTTEMEHRFGAPALHAIKLSRWAVENANSSGFFCRVLRVTTLTKPAALDASKGIGFYYRGYAGEG